MKIIQSFDALSQVLYGVAWSLLARKAHASKDYIGSLENLSKQFASAK